MRELTDVGLASIQAESVTDAVVLADRQSSSRNRIQDECRADAFNVGDIGDRFNPGLVDLVQAVGIRNDSLVTELDAERKLLAYLRSKRTTGHGEDFSYRNIWLGDNIWECQSMGRVTLWLRETAGIAVKLAKWDGGETVVSCRPKT